VLAREGDPGRGELVWRAHCVECHGEDGTGTEEGVDLTDRPISAEDLAQRFLEGRGMMQGLADELSTKQAADVLAWLQAEIVPPE
jgi:mono/diheme cytochrome c family protein